MPAPRKSAPRAADLQDLLAVDRVIHEPARLAIMAVLASCEAADFRYLRGATTLTDGNLSAHLNKLEEAGYISVEKRFVEKKPNTLYRVTSAGREAFQRYRSQVSKWIGK